MSLSLREDCVACLSEHATVQLQPCLHTPLCSACVIRLERAQCPTCRSVVDNAKWGGKERLLVDVIAERERRTETDWSTTAQVVVLGAMHSRDAGITFMERVKKMYGKSEHLISQLEGEKWESRYASQIRVEGRNVRWNWLKLPENEAERRGFVGELLEYRADFLLLACTLEGKGGFEEMIKWDARLREMFGGGMPRRMWMVMVEGGRKTDVSRELGFRDILARAWSEIPLESQPLTCHLVRVTGKWWGAWGVRKVVKRCVVHAWETRAMIRRICE